MAVTTECPHCKQKYQVQEARLGRHATCRKCGQGFTVEMKADETIGPAARDAQKPAESPAAAGHADEGQEAPEGELTPDAARPVPQKIGPYTVRRRLGGGAMGEVWLAWDPALQRDVALKTLRPEVALRSQGLDRFLREARLAAKLHHTNAVTVYQVGVEGTTAYIAMEYVAGQSLDTAVSPGRPLDWREATRAVRDAAAGLVAAHKLGLIHRDIKPANLMRTTDGVTKVVDFGLARADAGQTQLTQQGVLLGTPAYMAPELWRHKEADVRSDLYALACSYYCLVTGDVPFDAGDFMALGYQHTHEPLPDPRQRVPDLPDGVCRILAKGASKDPDDRYQSAVAMWEELEALLATPPESLVFALPSGTTPPTHSGTAPAAAEPTGISRFSRTRTALAGAIRHGVTQTLPTLVRRAAAGIRRIPRSRAGLGLAAAAFLVMLGLVLLLRTGSGTVTIELSDPQAHVEVKVDGAVIDIVGLKEPLRLKVGEHDLLVQSGDFESVSQSFTVRRGEQQVLRVTLQPKPPPPRPAVYTVTVDPPQATVTVEGSDATVTGNDAVRTITVPVPDGQTRLQVIATLAGHESREASLQPQPGERKSVTLQLKASPRPPLPTAAGTDAGKDPAEVIAKPSPAAAPTVDRPLQIRARGIGITAMAMSPDGRLVACADLNGSIRLWDATTGVCQRTLQEDKPVHHVAFSPDGKQLASGGTHVKVWDAASGDLICGSLDVSAPQALAFERDGILCAVPRQPLRVLSATSGKTVQRFDKSQLAAAAFPRIAVSPNAAYVAAVTEDSGTGLVHVLDRKSGNSILHSNHLFNGNRPSGAVAYALGFSPDSKLLVLALSAAMDAKKRGLRAWRIPESAPASSRAREPMNVLFERDVKEPHALWFSPDGTNIAAADLAASKLLVWETATGKCRRELAVPPGAAVSLLVSPDGKRAAMACLQQTPQMEREQDETIKIWNLDLWGGGGQTPGADAATAPGPTAADATAGAAPEALPTAERPRVITSNCHAVADLAFSPEGDLLVCGDENGTTYVFAVKNGVELSPLYNQVGEKSLHGLAFAPGSRRLVTVGQRTAVWDVGFAELVADFDGIDRFTQSCCVAFSPDGARFVLGDSKGSLAIFSTATLQPVQSLTKGKEASMFQVTWSADGRRIAATERQVTKLKVRIWDAATGTEQKCSARDGRVIALSPDAEKLAVWNRDTGAVRIFKCSTDEGLCAVQGTVKDTSTYCFVPGTKLWFSPDGTRLAASDCEKNAILVWDAASGKPLRRLAMPAGPCRTVALSPDGKLAAVASQSSPSSYQPVAIKIWAVDLWAGQE